VSRGAIWTEHALEDAERLDVRTRERIVAAIDRLATTGHGDLNRLHGRDREFRLRVGDWRVLLTLDPDTGNIVILRVLRRDRAYR
jgi:mRNA-degrading endonuclease RelE of RelBE toxin-antitoxin system